VDGYLSAIKVRATCGW